MDDVGKVAPFPLERHARLLPWIIIVGNLLFAITDWWLNHGRLVELTGVKLVVVVVQLAALGFLRRRPGRRWTIVAVWACVAAGAAGGTIAGVLVRDPFTTPLLCTAGALVTAAVVPWGRVAQLGVAVIMLLAGSLDVYLITGLPTALYPIVGIAMVAGLSVYIADTLDRQRRAEARARVELARHQAELAHVLRVGAMGEMAAQLAHELTQPLGAIANYAAGCRRRMTAAAGQGDELVDAVDRIQHEALRAGEIIRRLREFLRKAEPRRAPVDVNRLVREVVGLVEGEAQENGVALQMTLDPDLPQVDADAIQIEQVLINLVRNALEAMHENPGDAPTLGIDTRLADATHIEVAVCDSGPGLANGDMAKIFEPFHTTKRAGLGMGLAISRSIVEAHGGQLWAVLNPARGLTCRFTLPVPAP